MLPQLRLPFRSGNGAFARLAVLLVLSLFTAQAISSPAGTPDTVQQEIRYSAAGANEVFLVWGINDWKQADSAAWPATTFVKDNLLYTPMQEKNGSFTVSMKLPAGTLLDYVFWITKGPRSEGTDIWDKNLPHKDYHTYVQPGSIALVESKLIVQPARPLSLLDFSLPVMLLSMLVAGGFIYFHRRYYNRWMPPHHPVTILIGAAIVLFLSLMLIRPSVSGSSWELYANPGSFFPRVIQESFYDFLYVLVLTLLFLVPLLLLKNYPRVRVALLGTFLFVGLCSMLIGILNIRIVELLGKPFNYQWLYYSDFLRSPDSQAAVSANVSWGYITSILMLCLAAGLLAIPVTGALTFTMARTWPRRVFAGGAALTSVALIFTGYNSIHKGEYNYDRLSNPITAFLQSVNPFASHPALFTMEVPDSLQYVPPLKAELRPGKKPAAKIRNVIVFVLESTPAEYLQVYGSGYKATPNLLRYGSGGIVFDNVYAHAPATNLSMVSMLGSVYPWLSYNSLTEEHPDLDIQTISSELKTYGYRTGFFNSADNRFQKAGEFLAHREFDAITDCETGSCKDSRFELKSDWDYMNGKDDACTGDEMFSWITAGREKPFFAMMWTYQTHYPYFFTGKEKDYKTGDASLNRYLNALNHADAVFGKMMARLKKEKLAESTLVVVVGDHGEAFGRHGQISHGRMIYEENLHVPCMFIHPSLKKSKQEVVGGMIDVAPTIMEMLGYREPSGWQGESLLAENRNPRTYFFAPWSDYLFGYREGNQKYIYNATKNKTEIYDLTDDPMESENLAAYLPAEVELCHQRLAAWTQYVNKFMLTTLTTRPKKQLASRK